LDAVVALAILAASLGAVAAGTVASLRLVRQMSIAVSREVTRATGAAELFNARASYR
jgi:hypothetical protein